MVIKDEVRIVYSVCILLVMCTHTYTQALITQLNQLPTESVVSVHGQVQSRPKQDRNTVSPKLLYCLQAYVM